MMCEIMMGFDETDDRAQIAFRSDLRRFPAAVSSMVAGLLRSLPD